MRPAWGEHSYRLGMTAETLGYPFRSNRCTELLHQTMRRIRLTLSYDGTNYFGWQIQPDLPTIQGELERVLKGFQEQPVKVHGSGRTDAGVHALGQVAAFDFCNPVPPENLRRALNRLLPRDIRVLEVADTDPGFHPRYHATAKTYRYRIHREMVCPPFERLYVWHHPYPLNEERMVNAACIFLGKHNFRAFAAADERYTEDADMTREIFCSELSNSGQVMVYEVRGTGFLKHMVRNLVGALVEIGSGNLNEDDLREMLSTGVRQLGIRTAPPEGLFLVNVDYADGQHGGSADSGRFAEESTRGK